MFPLYAQASFQFDVVGSYCPFFCGNMSANHIFWFILTRTLFGKSNFLLNKIHMNFQFRFSGKKTKIQMMVTSSSFKSKEIENSAMFCRDDQNRKRHNDKTQFSIPGFNFFISHKRLYLSVPATIVSGRRRQFLTAIRRRPFPCAQDATLLRRAIDYRKVLSFAGLWMMTDRATARHPRHISQFYAHISIYQFIRLSWAFYVYALISVSARRPPACPPPYPLRQLFRLFSPRFDNGHYVNAI